MSETLKISDLAVGDWVKVGDGLIAQVEYPRLRHDLVGVRFAEPFRAQAILVEKQNVELEYIHPIPITPEILKSNGWYEDDYDTGTDYITDNTVIMYNKERKDWKACIMNGSPVVRVKVFFSYVHELQQALRLAGINKEIVL